MIKKSLAKHLTPEVMTDLLVVPTGKRIEVVMIWATNPGTSNKKLELDMYNKENDETIVLLDDYTINSKGILQLGGDYNTFVCMQAGDKLMAEGNNNSNFTIIVSYIEREDLF